MTGKWQNQFRLGQDCNDPAVRCYPLRLMIDDLGNVLQGLLMVSDISVSDYH